MAVHCEAGVIAGVDSGCQRPSPKPLIDFDIGLAPRVSDQLGVEVPTTLSGQWGTERVVQGQHDPENAPAYAKPAYPMRMSEPCSRPWHRPDAPT